LAGVLGHLRRIDLNALFLAAHWRWGGAVTPSFFEELARNLEWRELPRMGLLEDTLQMLERLGRPLVQFSCRTELQQQHDFLASKLDEGEVGVRQRESDI